MATKDDVMNNPNWQSFLDAWKGASWDQGAHFSETNRQEVGNKLSQLVSSFQSQFNSLVGRLPTDAETATYYQQFLVPNAPDISNKGSVINQDFNNYLRDFLNSTYQQTAKDYATQQLQAQGSQANDLSNLFRAQGREAINSTEQSLLDYQSRLFEKLRPNLITSLKAQNLLDTGGLNEAMAGAQADLANSVQPFLAEKRLANEQDANQIAFAGASAPYEYQRANIMNQVPYLQSLGEEAMNRGYNTFLTNLNFQHQMDMLNRQTQIAEDMKPGFLDTLKSSFATGLGASFSPTAAFEAYKNYGTGYNQMQQGRKAG